MSGTILPSLPPLADDYVVTVCAACKFRFCLLGCVRCDSRKNGDPGETTFTVAELRASGSLEHHSYWRIQPGDDFEMPKSIEDVKELVTNQRDKSRSNPLPGWSYEEHARTCAGYLIEQLGLDEEQCRDAIRDIWPELSEAIEIARLQIHADKMRASAGYPR